MPASTLTVSETVTAVRKYIGQLEKESKIGHALRKLNRLNLTEPVMAETAVGRAVNRLRDHPKHGKCARDLLEKWIAIAAEAKGIVMDAPEPLESRKRPATDGFTTASGLSFEEALRECSASAPAKKVKLAPTPTAELNETSGLTPATSNEATPVAASIETDDLFVIERKHSRSRVYSGRQKASGVTSSSPPTIDSLLQDPSTATYKQVEPVLQRCTVEQLQRIELLNPQWQRQIEIIWREICLRDFPRATARDTFSWRLTYQKHIQQHEDRLAAIKSSINKNTDAQVESTVQLVPVSLKKVNEKVASSSHRAPLAPINGRLESPNLSTPAIKTAAPTKARPAPLMAKALKMMKYRHGR